VDVIYTDFSKAFDKIDHNILAAKLYNLGFRNPFYSWLVSFISDKKQYIKVKNIKSPLYIASSGIPQGCHLAPLLFNIYINDIKITNSRLLFADDLKIFQLIKSPNDAKLLQNDLNLIHNWCVLNKLYFNIDTCKIMTYSKKRVTQKYKYYINDIELDRVFHIKDLGICFDPSLSFNDHYAYVINKASSMLGFVSRFCSDFNNPVALKTLYCSFVRSILNYNSVV